MKIKLRLCLFLGVLFFLPCLISAQETCDTLVLTNGSKRAVQVIKSEKNEIVCTPCSDDRGSVYSIPVYQVSGIIKTDGYHSINELKSSNIGKEIESQVEIKNSNDSTRFMEKGRWVVGLSTQSPRTQAFFLGIEQISQGNSSNTGFQIGKQNDTKVTVINFSPTIGYAITDNFIFGISLGMENYEFEDDNLRNFYFGPFVRGYFPAKTNLVPFVEIRTQSNFFQYSNNTESLTTLSGRLGLAYFLNNYISLDVFGAFDRAQRNRTFSSINYKESFSQFGLGLGVNAFF